MCPQLQVEQDCVPKSQTLVDVPVNYSHSFSFHHPLHRSLHLMDILWVNWWPLWGNLCVWFACCSSNKISWVKTKLLEYSDQTTSTNSSGTGSTVIIIILGPLLGEFQSLFFKFKVTSIWEESHSFLIKKHLANLREKNSQTKRKKCRMQVCESQICDFVVVKFATLNMNYLNFKHKKLTSPSLLF